MAESLASASSPDAIGATRSLPSIRGFQGCTDQFFIIAGEDMTVGIGGRRPYNFPSTERVRRFQKGCATNFLVTTRSQLCADDLPLVRVEQNGIAVGRQMNAGAILQVGYLVGLPNLLPGACVQ